MYNKSKKIDMDTKVVWSKVHGQNNSRINNKYN